MDFSTVKGITIPEGNVAVLRVGGQKVWQRLPSEYQEVEWIGTTGTQWLDTGVYTTINTKARVKFVPTGIDIVGYFGARIDPARFCLTTFSNGSYMAFSMSNNTWSSNRTQVVLNNIYELTAYNGKQIVNGIEYNEPLLSSFECTVSFKLGADTYMQGTRGKYYVCQIWENGVAIRDLIPCYRISNNEIGMYDLVNGVFHTNQGTGTFIKGNDL